MSITRDFMQSKVITYLDKDIALEQIKIAKNAMDKDISDMQLIDKTKNTIIQTKNIYTKVFNNLLFI